MKLLMHRAPGEARHEAHRLEDIGGGSRRNRVRVLLIEGFKDLLQVGIYMK